MTGGAGEFVTKVRLVLDALDAATGRAMQIFRALDFTRSKATGVDNTPLRLRAIGASHFGGKARTPSTLVSRIIMESNDA